MPEHHSLSIWLYNSLFRKYDLAKFGKAMKQKRFIFTTFNAWGWYTTLFTIMKDLGLYFWGRLCTEAYSKVMLRESTEPKSNTRLLWILFVHHSVTKISSIDIFFFINDIRTKLCTNIFSYQAYIRSIKIFILQFSIKYTINTNLSVSVTKSTKSIFVLEQLTNVK